MFTKLTFNSSSRKFTNNETPSLFVYPELCLCSSSISTPVVEYKGRAFSFLYESIVRITRITETSESLIDVMLASSKNLVKETKVVPSSISDHDLIYAVLNLKRCPQTPTYITTRSYKNYQRDAFIHDLSQVPWHIIETFDDVEDSLHAFNILLCTRQNSQSSRSP